MLAAADELRERIASGEVHSVALVVEIAGRDAPLAMILGRYRTQPLKAMAAFHYFRAKIQNVAACTSGPSPQSPIHGSHSCH